jgi:mono/diheme cytochrome c family protein
MEMSSKRLLSRLAIAGAVTSAVVAVAATAAFGHSASTPANIATGETLFTSSGCSACHTFKYARATGKIGPNLDTPVLTVAQIEKQITDGGDAIMTKAAAAKYKFPMSSFKSRLSTTKIDDIAEFVYTDRDKAPPAASKTTTTPATTTPATTTPATTTPATTTPATTTPATTTTASTGGGTDTLDDCPTGKTIPTSGNTDGDDDDNGAQTDGDGCI